MTMFSLTHTLFFAVQTIISTVVFLLLFNLVFYTFRKRQETKVDLVKANILAVILYLVYHVVSLSLTLLKTIYIPNYFTDVIIVNTLFTTLIALIPVYFLLKNKSLTTKFLPTNILKTFFISFFTTIATLFVIGMLQFYIIKTVVI